MNPVHLKPTVEVIRGLHTSDGTIDVVQQLLGRSVQEGDHRQRLARVCVESNFACLHERGRVCPAGRVATAEKIDPIFKKCFGHKMGPLETADLIGLDTVVRSLDVLYESFQDPKYRCCPLLRKLVHAGHLGRKTGQGFYVYPDGL